MPVRFLLPAEELGTDQVRLVPIAYPRSLSGREGEVLLFANPADFSADMWDKNILHMWNDHVFGARLRI